MSEGQGKLFGDPKIMQKLSPTLSVLLMLATSISPGTGYSSVKVYRSYANSPINTPQHTQIQITSNENAPIIRKMDDGPLTSRDIHQFPEQLNLKQNSSFTEGNRKIEAILPVHPKTHYLAEKFSEAVAPLLSIFSLWTDKCWTAGFDQGTCYSRSECIAKGGSPRGICAGGFGVCCIIAYSCGEVTTLNRTYFVNPEYPNFVVPDRHLKCRHSVVKLDGVCQLRLDFDRFYLESPNPENGLCLHDFLTVEGIDYKLPPLCGDLTGHHVYLPIGFGPEVSYFIALSPGSPHRRWKIRTTKIRCYSSLMAPGGCLQYHQSVDGQVTSFNYGDGALSNINRLNYGICVRREKGFCAIQWSKCSHRKKRSTIDYYSRMETNPLQPKDSGWIPKESYSEIDAKRMARIYSIHQDSTNLSNDQRLSKHSEGKPADFSKSFKCPEGNFTLDQLSALELELFIGNRTSENGSVDNPSSIPIPSAQLSSCLQILNQSDRGTKTFASDSWKPIISNRHEAQIYRTDVNSSHKEHEHFPKSLVLNTKMNTPRSSQDGDTNTLFLRKAQPNAMKTSSIYKLKRKANNAREEILKKPVTHTLIFPPRNRGIVSSPKPVLKYHQAQLPLPVGNQVSNPLKVKVDSVKIKTNPVKVKTKPASSFLTKGIGSNILKPNLNSKPLLVSKATPRPKVSLLNKIKRRPHHKAKPKPNKKPWHKRVSKVKPKPTKSHKPKNKKNGCKKVIPFPFPVLLPFPLGGGGGGGGGGKGHDDDNHGWGWSDDKIVSDIEPYLIRVVTDSKKEDGLKAICLEWEQIPCDMWHPSPSHQFSHEEL